MDRNLSANRNILPESISGVQAFREYWTQDQPEEVKISFLTSSYTVDRTSV